ncbi:MAG: methyltransferase domain-containing protein [bacterium]
MENNQPDPLTPTAAPRASCPLPLQLELDAVQRILAALHAGKQPCLDIGFQTPGACQRLRACGGYWTSLATTRETCARLAAELVEEVVLLEPHAQLPFEDKQFDVVVLALGSLSGDSAMDTALVRECHRVLKVSGCLILTVGYARPLGLATLLHHRRQVAGSGGQYSEAALFDLLKTGFDWLGLRTYCRFWVQMVRQWVDSRQPEAGNTPLLAALYWAARICDCLTFFTRGYLVTAYGRRKGWRPRQTPKLADGRSISDVVLLRRNRF